MNFSIVLQRILRDQNHVTTPSPNNILEQNALNFSFLDYTVGHFLNRIKKVRRTEVNDKKILCQRTKPIGRLIPSGPKDHG